MTLKNLSRPMITKDTSMSTGIKSTFTLKSSFLPQQRCNKGAEMRIILLSLSIIAVMSTASHADIVHCNNGFTYEGEVTADPNGGYWVDGAYVAESELKSIVLKEFNPPPVTSHAVHPQDNWYAKMAASWS